MSLEEAASFLLCTSIDLTTCPSEAEAEMEMEKRCGLVRWHKE
jgi:hypothetical protein